MSYVITLKNRETGKGVQTSLDHLRPWFAKGFVVVAVEKEAEDKKAS